MGKRSRDATKSRDDETAVDHVKTREHDIMMTGLTVTRDQVAKENETTLRKEIM